MRDSIMSYKYLYDGFYKSFYHARSDDKIMTKCMDSDTIDNIMSFGKIIRDPLSLFDMKNLQSDLSLFGEFAEVASDLTECHFEEPMFDLWNMCTEEPEACAVPKITENLTKNMFVFIGKLTQMGETIAEMNKETNSEEYNKLMREIGTDGGTMLRDLFAYQGIAPSLRKDKKAAPSLKK